MIRRLRAIVPALTLLLAATCVAVQTDRALLVELQAHLRAGELEAALATARQAVEVHRDLPELWYNLAGLEAHHGHEQAAIQAFERATILGYDDFRQADTDPDLAALRQLDHYQQLRSAWAQGLAASRRQRAIGLTAGQWSPPIVVREDGVGLDPLAATLKLRADHGGLQIELALAGPELPPQPPWRGGGGVLLSLTLPEDPVTGEGVQGVDLGFGWLDDLPAGAIRLGNHWQRLSELNPKLRYNHDEQQLHLDVRLPWSVCGTLHPLVDRELNLNLAYIQHDEQGRRHASLLADPGLGRADRPWRRGVPLRITWADGDPVIQGRVDNAVIRDGRLQIDGGALLPTGRRQGEMHLAMRDAAGDLVAELDAPLLREGARWSGTATLGVPPQAGSCRLGMSLRADGARGLASWETTVAVIPDGWEEATRLRLAAAPPRERPSLQLRLDAILTALAGRHPRDDAGALATTLDELEAMLAHLEVHGTALPSGGGFLAAAPATDGSPSVPCSLSLPPGWQRGDRSPVLLVLARAPGAEERAISLVPRLLAEHAQGTAAPALVVAVPHLPAQHEPELAAARVQGLVTWLRQFLDCGPVHVAAVDLLAATCLDLSAVLADDLAGLLFFTGVGFEPYAAGAIEERVALVPPELPVGWIWFPDEVRRQSDQAEAVRRALHARGHELQPRQAVPGGLRFDQAWMRAVLWAAELADGE